MIIPVNINLITSSKDVRSLIAIYMHVDSTGTVQYIGVTPLRELFTNEDAYSNTLWTDVFARHGKQETLEIRVHGVTTDEREAYMEQHRLIRLHQPYCNIKGYNIETRHRNVECIETGEIFPTITACAVAHGLAYSQLNQHLNGKPSHLSVKGRTYRRTAKAIS